MTARTAQTHKRELVMAGIAQTLFSRHEAILGSRQAAA
jgi:hypothetical protein